MRHRQPYGSNWSKLHGEAYRIWLSSEEEPSNTPEFGMVALMTVDDEQDKAPAMAAEVWRHAELLLTPKQVAVLRFRFMQELTQAEIAEKFSVSPERIRQIENAGLITLQHNLDPRRIELRRRAVDFTKTRGVVPR